MHKKGVVKLFRINFEQNTLNLLLEFCCIVVDGITKMKTKEEHDGKEKERYSVICQLGKGACGAVYLVRNAENKK